MHSSKYLAVLGALLSSVIAAPLVKRELTINTVTEIDTVTEYATATVWVDADNIPATTVLSFSPATPTTTIFTVSPNSPKAEHVTSPVPTSTTTPQAVVQTPTVQPAAETPITTSVYVAPAPTTPATTPTPTPTPAPAATTVQSTSSTSSSSGQYTGEITFYDVGLGSCGITNTNSDMVVAMAAGLMNKATMCGKSITINYGGKSHVATVVDTCPGCKDGSLDLSPSLFDVFASQDQGRVSGATWSFN